MGPSSSSSRHSIVKLLTLRRWHICSFKAQSQLLAPLILQQVFFHLDLALHPQKLCSRFREEKSRRAASESSPASLPSGADVVSSTVDMFCLHRHSHFLSEANLFSASAWLRVHTVHTLHRQKCRRVHASCFFNTQQGINQDACASPEPVDLLEGLPADHAKASRIHRPHQSTPTRSAKKTHPFLTSKQAMTGGTA